MSSRFRDISSVKAETSDLTDLIAGLAVLRYWLPSSQINKRKTDDVSFFSVSSGPKEDNGNQGTFPDLLDEAKTCRAGSSSDNVSAEPLPSQLSSGEMAEPVKKKRRRRSKEEMEQEQILKVEIRRYRSFYYVVG